MCNVDHHVACSWTHPWILVVCNVGHYVANPSWTHPWFLAVHNVDHRVANPSWTHPWFLAVHNVDHHVAYSSWTQNVASHGHKGFWVWVHCDLVDTLYGLESRSWLTLKSTIIVWKIQTHVSNELRPGHGFMLRVHSKLTLQTWPWRKVMTSLGHVQQSKYYQCPTWRQGVTAWTRILATCALWPWRNDLESSSWHTLGSRTTNVGNII